MKELVANFVCVGLGLKIKMLFDRFSCLSQGRRSKVMLGEERKIHMSQTTIQNSNTALEQCK